MADETSIPFDLGKVHCIDCIEAMKRMPDASVDSIVTDPPAGISFMGKGWDSDKGGRDKWIEWLQSVAVEMLRVLKPGGHALVWALPRTSHWTAMALENGGFEVRDRISHLFGQGFPKSHPVSGAIDKAHGMPDRGRAIPVASTHLPVGKYVDDKLTGNPVAAYDPVTDEAKKWSGWGTALKPACEDWWLCRKPLEGTVAANVLKHGTGALNVDGCRIGTSDRPLRECDPKPEACGAVYAGRQVAGHGFDGGSRAVGSTTLGRWPANLVLSHSPECRMVGTKKVKVPVINRFTDGAKPFGGGVGHPFESTPCGDEKGEETVEVWDCVDDCPVRMIDEQSGERKAGGVVRGSEPSSTGQNGIYGHFSRVANAPYEDTGGASRFFYCAKTSRGERGDGNNHPTVKPLSLMRYLCRLITPPNGIVLDPFAGSGTTGIACKLEGFRFIGFDKEDSYVSIANKRIEGATENVGEVRADKAKPGQQIGLLADLLGSKDK